VRAVLLAAAVVLAVSAYVVVRQPVDSPWWIYADPDATYAASSLNLLLGEDTRLFGHPGVPEQELLALTFGADRFLHRTPTREYVDERLLNLDRTRWAFRGWAIAFFLGGALLTFATAARLLGNWAWGLIGGLLWTAAPDFAAGAIQIRPDVLLSGLSVAALFLITRAAQRRSAPAYFGAAVLIGLTLTVKIHAVGLLPALVVAAAVRPPPRSWWRSTRAAVFAFVRAHPRAFTLGAATWLVVAVVVNRNRVPFDVSGEEVTLVLGVPLVVAAWLLASGEAMRRWRARAFDAFYPALAAALLVGIALPLTIFIDVGFEMTTRMREALAGGGANEGVPLFTLDWSMFESFPLRQALVLFILAGVAAGVGALRRDLLPMLWFLAAAAMGVLGAARLGALRYFEPAYVLSIVPALWLFSSRRAIGAVLAAVIVTALVVWPSLERADDPARSARAEERYAAEVDRAAAPLLGENDVALVTDYAPVADGRYWGTVANFVAYTPPYPYRFLPDYGPALATAAPRRIHYYFGPAAASLSSEGTLTLGSGTWYARPVPERFTSFFGVAELQSPPGHPEARYDARDGLYRDATGNAYDNAGDPSN
jgi:hypothetical protein